MSPRAWLLLCFSALACSDDATPIDAGTDGSVIRCARLGDPPNRNALRECEVCFEPHATLLSSARATAELVAVEDGVLVTYQAPFPTVLLVGNDGQIIDTLLPYIAPPGIAETVTELRVVPDSQRVWAITNQRGPALDRSLDVIELVLFEVSSVGLARIAEVELPGRVGDSAALSNGELLFEQQDPTDNTLPGPLMSCELESEIVCRQLNLTDGFIARIWDLAENRAVVVTTEFGGFGGDDAWIQTIDVRAGSVVAGPTPIQAESSSEFEPDEAPRVKTSPQSAYVVHPDRTAAVLLRGTVAGLDAFPFSHYYLRRIDSNGELIDAPPGVWINPDSYVARDAVESLTSGGIRRAPRSRTWVSWPTDALFLNYVQIVEPSGASRFATPLVRRITNREVGVPAYIDGSDHAYMRASTVADNPEREFQDDFNVDLIGDDLNFAWPTPVYYQECDRIDETPIAAVGAFDEGVWVAWEDVVVGEVDGLPYTLLKIARVMPDGDYGWRFDE